MTYDAHMDSMLNDYLAGCAAARLRRSGVARVSQSGLCTAFDTRFYSHRRDGRTGRIATLAWLEKATPNR